MAEKVSLKIFIVISFLCGILSACMSPIDIEVFLSAPEVQAVIDATKKPPPSVKIDPDSDDPENSLKAGDGFISGLIPGKYYRVEEYDQEDKTSKKNFFLQSDGKLNADLGKIGVLPEGKDKIEGLTNNYLYKVILAQPFDKNGTYEYFTLTTTGSDIPKATVSTEDDGITKLAVKTTEGGKYYLDLSCEIKADKIYKVKANIESWNSSSRSSAHSNLTGSVSITSLNINKTENYTQDFSGNIGIYQYRSDNNNTTFNTEGNISLTDKSIIGLDDTTLSNYVFVEYKDAKQGSEIASFTVLSVELKQTPIVSDFNISGNGTFPYDGSPKTVTITAKEGKSQGTVSVKYNGNTTAPTNAGTYTVTFDVAEAIGWEEVKNLPAGTLEIEKATPVAADFNISGIGTFPYNGSPRAVTITPKEGKSQGTVSVKYNGKTTAPTDVGTYTVTFDVVSEPNWNEANELLAGTLTIVDLFNITVDWSGLQTDKPQFSDNSSFNQTNGVLIIDVTITNHTNWGKFEWTASHTANPLVSEDTNPSHGYHLLLTLDASTNGLVWSVPGEFTIKVLLDGTYDAEFTFTRIP